MRSKFLHKLRKWPIDHQVILALCSDIRVSTSVVCLSLWQCKMPLQNLYDSFAVMSTSLVTTTTAVVVLCLQCSQEQCEEGVAGTRRKVATHHLQ